MSADVERFAYEVVIPAWNAESFIAETIESVLHQSVPPRRVTVVDDGSTDRTVLIAKRLGADAVTRARGGVVAARNTGLSGVRTAFAAFVDADDVWEVDFAERVRDSWPDSSDHVGAIGTLVTLFGDGELSGWQSPPANGRLETISLAEAWNENPLTASAIMFRAEALRSVGGWRDSTAAGADPSSEPIVSVEDYDLTLRLLAAGWTVARLGSHCARYRVRGGSWSSRVVEAMRSEERTLEDIHQRITSAGHGEQFDLGTRLNRLWWRSVARAAHYRQPVSAVPFPERSRPTVTMHVAARLLGVPGLSRLAAAGWRTWRRARPRST